MGWLRALLARRRASPQTRRCDCGWTFTLDDLCGLGDPARMADTLLARHQLWTHDVPTVVIR